MVGQACLLLNYHLQRIGEGSAAPPPWIGIACLLYAPRAHLSKVHGTGRIHPTPYEHICVKPQPKLARCSAVRATKSHVLYKLHARLSRGHHLSPQPLRPTPGTRTSQPKPDSPVAAAGGTPRPPRPTSPRAPARGASENILHGAYSPTFWRPGKPMAFRGAKTS